MRRWTFSGRLLAYVPDRHEPGTGEINFPWLLDAIDRLGYEGVVDTLSLAPGANGTAEVSLVPAALSLAPVVVNVERERRSTIPGFEERAPSPGVAGMYGRDVGGDKGVGENPHPHAGPGEIADRGGSSFLGHEVW